jgi:transcriptional pleiotropic regulator of transition state genes
MSNEIAKLTSKGQMTIPVKYRKALNIKKGDSVLAILDGKEIRLKKLEIVSPLSENDPIWKIIGAGESNKKDISVNHDKYLAEGEIKHWA